MSTLITKLCSLRNILTVQKLSMGQLRYSSTQIKETDNEIFQGNEDSSQLITMLKSDINPVHIISTLKANKMSLDGRHLTTALSSLYKFYKTNSSSNIEKKGLHVQEITSILNSNVRKLYLPEIIDSLKLLNLLNVSSSSLIMQKLLQLLRSSINDLDVTQIVFLSLLLPKLRKTNLSDVIHKALPQVFTAQLKIKLNTEDIVELTKALRYAALFVTDEEAIVFILDILDQYKSAIDVKDAISIIISLCHIENLSESYSNLMLRMIGSLKEQDKSVLMHMDISTMLKKLLKKISMGNEEFYDSTFIDMLIAIFINNNGDFDQGLKILNNLNKLNHINKPLLQYLLIRSYQNPVLLESSHNLNVLVLTNAMSAANYCPNFWNNLQKIFINNCKRLPDDTKLGYLIFYLATLDCFDSNMLEHHFSVSHDVNLLTKNYLPILQIIYQSVKILHPEYVGPWYSNDIIQSFKTLENCEIENHDLLPMLEKILGDSCYIQTNVQTNLGLIIDHLIVYENESPVILETVATSQNEKCLTLEADLKIPPDSKRVAVLLLSPENYNRNIQILNPFTRLKIKLLEAMSYRVVQVSIDTMKNIPEFEIIPYLSHLIKEQLEGNGCIRKKAVPLN